MATSEAETNLDALRVLVLAGRLGLDGDGWSPMPLIERLEQRGVSVQVLCLDRNQVPEGLGRIVERPGLRHRWLRWLNLRHLLGSGRLRRPDLIHVVHDEMSDAALALADHWRIPYLVSIGDFEIVDHGLRISDRWCRALVAASPELARTLHDELGVPRRLIKTIPPGITARDLPTHALELNRIPVIGCAGPAVDSTGFHTFLEAVRAVLAAGRDVEFIIGIQGDDDLDVRQRAQRMGIGDRITVADFSFLGPRFWTVLDVYCQPSLCPSTGRILATAMVNRIPCIASDVAGHRQLIEDGRTGLIVPRGEPFPLARAVLTLLDDRAAARALAQAGAESVAQRFDPASEVDQLFDLYRELASMDLQPASP